MNYPIEYEGTAKGAVLEILLARFSLYVDFGELEEAAQEIVEAVVEEITKEMLG